jgi:hypothetical protein
MRFLHAHISEFVLGSLSFLIGIGFIFTKGKDEPEGYIIAAVGLQITIALFLLKSEIHSKLDEKLELYRLLSGIHHPELLDQGHEVIENCKESLRQLANGKYRDRADRIFYSIADKIANARKEVLAVHVGWTVTHIEAWNSPHMARYYEKNKEAVKRGVKVKRIFILFKETLWNSETDCLDESVSRVLNRQQRDGIDVLVVWNHDVEEKTYIQDWVMVDAKWVEYGAEAGGFVSSGWSHKDAVLSVNSHKLRTYFNKFKRLEGYADRWADNTKQDLECKEPLKKSFPLSA